MQDSAARLEQDVATPEESVAAERPRSTLPLRLIDVDYLASGLEILQQVNLEIHAGGPTALLGPNGSGKTTLLKLAMGLLRPTKGFVLFGRTASSLCVSGLQAMILQKPVMLRRSVSQNVAFALRAAGRTCDSLEIARLLELTRIGHLAARPARHLSGGEQQRLAFARALARKPQVLYLDEPTANLDPAATRHIEEIVRQVSLAGVKVVMATHDLAQARRLATDIVFLARGRVIEQAAAASFFATPTTDEGRRFLAGELVL
jgi:tungstate transport system ATP-binding protein